MHDRARDATAIYPGSAIAHRCVRIRPRSRIYDTRKPMRPPATRRADIASPRATRAVAPRASVDRRADIASIDRRRSTPADDGSDADAIRRRRPTTPSDDDGSRRRAKRRRAKRRRARRIETTRARARGASGRDARIDSFAHPFETREDVPRGGGAGRARVDRRRGAGRARRRGRRGKRTGTTRARPGRAG